MAVTVKTDLSITQAKAAETRHFACVFAFLEAEMTLHRMSRPQDSQRKDEWVTARLSAAEKLTLYELARLTPQPGSVTAGLRKAPGY